MCKFFSNFAPDMKKLALIIVLCFLSFAYAHAETIVLHTGARVKGTIVFQNDEVVIVRDEAGARFQYLRTDVAEIRSDDAEEAEQTDLVEDTEIQTSKKASILLEVAGGAAVLPNEAAGGAASVDLLVGSHHIGDRHLFIGGGLGYHGLFLGGEKYNFMPIQAALRMPFMEQKHAPVFGASLGYAIALSKDYTGGIYAGVDLGYRCQLNEKTAVSVVFYAQFLQAQMPTVTTIEGSTYTHYTGRNLVATGVKLALYF